MQNNAPFHLRDLTVGDLGQVANIHLLAFPESYLSKIGPEAIDKYYAWHMAEPNICYAVGAFQQYSLIGFGFAGVFRNAELFFIRDHWLYFLGVFLSHPGLLFNAEIGGRFRKMTGYIGEYLSLKSKNGERNHGHKQTCFGLLSIAVNPEKQRLGVGQALMDAVEGAAVAGGYQNMMLSVHPGNIQALAFYEKLGWNKVYYDQGQPWQGYMEKNLES